jgi:hypothetical protein
VDRICGVGHRSDVGGVRIRARRLIALLLLSAAYLAGASFDALAGEPLGPTTVRDRDDAQKRLDIRSVSVNTLSSGRTRVELVFWNGVPPRFLTRRAAGVEPGPYYFVRFWPGRHQLRVTWGDPASNCCLIHRAWHPDPYTYVTVIFLDGVEPPPTEVRGYATRKLECHRQEWCGTPGSAPYVDRTVWRDL